MGALSSITKCLLILATALSFLPQFNLIAVRGDARGISYIYVFLNGIVATEQFAVLLLCAALSKKRALNGTGTPPPVSPDSLDVVQMGTYWLCSSILLLWRVAYSNIIWRLSLLLLWFAISAVILIPSVSKILDRTVPYFGSHFGSQLMLNLHFKYFLPLCTALLMLAFVTEQKLLARYLAGLAVPAVSASAKSAQAIVFAVLAVSWAFRLRPTIPPAEAEGTLVKWGTWYSSVGWAFVNHAVIAFGQWVLFLIVSS